MFFLLEMKICMAIAQPPTVTDSLGQARSLVQQYRFREADRLIENFLAANSRNSGAYWLHAQILYNRNHITRAEDAYINAIRFDSTNKILKLDYVNFLMNTGKLGPAKAQAESFLQRNPDDENGKILLSHINYWRGDVKLAEHQLSELTPGKNQLAESLLQDVKWAEAPYFIFQPSYSFDDQPLRSLSNYFEGGAAKSALVNPKFSLLYDMLNGNDAIVNDVWLSAENRMILSDLRAIVSIKAGLYLSDLGNESTPEWTAGIDLYQHLVKQLSIDAFTERRPYNSNLSSVNESIMQDKTGLSFDWNRPGILLAHAGYQIDFFEDRNFVQAATGWFLATVIKTQKLELNAGYGFSYSTSNESRYTAAQPIDTIIANNSGSIPGVYNPYFTPLHQQIHSALASAKYNLSASVTIAANFNAGLYARADDPYFYLDKNSADESILVMAYSAQNFFPFEISTGLNFKITPLISLNANYRITRNNFYTQQVAMASLKILLAYEEK